MAAAESLIIQTTALCSFLLLVAWFSLWHLTGLVQTERQRAYVLTLLSSAIMTLSSVPLVWEILTTPNGFQQLLPTTDGNDYWWTIAATTFFMTFLVTDLAVGSIFYRSKIQVLTGWIHHIAYVGLLIWVIRNHYTPVFVAMCLLEAPTFMLALGSVFKSLRRDYVFAALFVPTRIVFHGYMIADVSFRKPFYWGICIALCITFALHCYWFYGFILQQKRLSTQKQAVAAAATDQEQQMNHHRNVSTLKTSAYPPSPSSDYYSHRSPRCGYSTFSPQIPENEKAKLMVEAI
ncbi:hypothetical protein VTP01DRAFT_4241 [Rhizomucor pusillus]|uniref:uncharacterized protein n=1 Tax=Rhizomucor pusillus TaxID=4840 RepID=UPI0037437A5D